MFARLWENAVHIPRTKEARQPIGRRAKFREETPVTRQDEEPNFALGPMMQRTTEKIQQKRRLMSIVFYHFLAIWSQFRPMIIKASK
jgi:hypothetical protein